MKDLPHIPIFQQVPEGSTPDASEFEPGFEYNRGLLLNNSNQQWHQGLASHLDRRIRRHPNDLTAHVQRINALVAAGCEGDRLFAAAVDLNTVLGRNGMALQQRIHDQISFALSQQQRTDLVALREGTLLSAGSAEMHFSLTRKHEDCVQLVSENKKGSNKVPDPLEFAIDR